MDVKIHIILTSALAGGEWSASRPGRFTPDEKDPGTHWKGGWVDPRASLDDVEKRKFLTLSGIERPTRSQSLYRPYRLCRTEPSWVITWISVYEYSPKLAHADELDTATVGKFVTAMNIWR
jgi:hypothetical protein